MCFVPLRHVIHEYDKQVSEPILLFPGPRLIKHRFLKVCNFSGMVRSEMLLLEKHSLFENPWLDMRQAPNKPLVRYETSSQSDHFDDFWHSGSCLQLCARQFCAYMAIKVCNCFCPFQELIISFSGEETVTPQVMSARVIKLTDLCKTLNWLPSASFLTG